jgi:hypothetical protein
METYKIGCFFCGKKDFKLNIVSEAHECQNCGREYNEYAFAQLQDDGLSMLQFNPNDKHPSFRCHISDSADDIKGDRKELVLDYPGMPESGPLKAAIYLNKIKPDRYRLEGLSEMEGMLTYIRLLDLKERKIALPWTLIDKLGKSPIEPEPSWKSSLIHVFKQPQKNKFKYIVHNYSRETNI